MIRFYEGNIRKSNPIDVTVFPDSVTFGEEVWQDGRAFFKRNWQYDNTMKVQLLPIEDENHKTICYAYQDDEANRELRMLKELEMCKDTLQFRDIFPEINEVVVCGCNELAYYFVKYLEKQHIDVAVTGRYWEQFGYEKEANIELVGLDKLAVFAERSNFYKGDSLYKAMARSASPEFECIDKIYEANIKAGKIKNTVGEISSVLEKLRGKDVIILGTNESAQDTYDLLLKHGIDIFCFAGKMYDGLQLGSLVVEMCSNTLLGKRVMEISDIMRLEKDVAFIDYNGKNSALGTKNVEKFDYYGYARNDLFFLINDYIDIPFSNLVHVLESKCICLAGDEILCKMVSDYLEDVGQGSVNSKYVQLSQCTAAMLEEKLLFVVYPWYAGDRPKGYMRPTNPKFEEFKEELELLHKKGISYSTYFSRTSALVLIDGCLNRKKEKYSIRRLTPKGILLGRIQATSGNVFVRGILDGHPDIIKWGFNDMNKNLFLYCVRLANGSSRDILRLLKKLFIEELALIDDEIPNWGIFEKNMETLLSVKDCFSSQELFVMFHIAYDEMIHGEKITDVNSKIIYWEPHSFPKHEFPYLAQWLADEKINGQTICMHRDNIVRAGSYYHTLLVGIHQRFSSLEAIYSLSRPTQQIMEMNDILEQKKYYNWKEFHVRFEDVKLHPEQELKEMCERLEIVWSDAMLQCTSFGQTWAWRGVVKDFDLRPVFNNYEQCLSAYDRFRISLLARSYQKRCGYAYEDSMKFTRCELQEMFLKKFRFQEELQFENEKEKIMYFLSAYEIIRWDLWEARKHEVMDDITPMFGKVDLFGYEYKRRVRTEAIQELVNLARQQENLVLYGTGMDCEALLERLGGDSPRLIFSDLKALYQDLTFRGEKVIAPTELNRQYGSYKILITSSKYYRAIQDQLEHLFDINPERIICNTYQLWEDDE